MILRLTNQTKGSKSNPKLSKILIFHSCSNLCSRLCPIDDTPCTNVGGLMDYGSSKSKWSCCSRHDFQTLFNMYNNANAWCLERIQDPRNYTGMAGIIQIKVRFI